MSKQSNLFGNMHGGESSKDEWLTPPSIIHSLRDFDLDPCSPVKRPWDTAKRHYTIEDDGLSLEWKGSVWLNPPYSKNDLWLPEMKRHGNGIALLFARTETKMFFNHIWNGADAILFLKGRIQFYNVDGSLGKTSAGAPSCLIAYGKTNAQILKQSKLAGKYFEIL